MAESRKPLELERTAVASVTYMEGVGIATSNYKSLPQQYPGAISISCSMPRWYSTSSVYKALAPRGFKNDPTRLYVPKYEALLDGLDPKEVVADLRALSVSRAISMGYNEDEARSFVPVVLCWEGPNEFCHRFMVAKWLEQECGFKVPEVKFKNGELTVVKRREKKDEQPDLFAF